jgi:arabinoxylan arabinofuranohydrolase
MTKEKNMEVRRMKKHYKSIALSFYIVLSALSGISIFADNPIIQTKFTADPAPMVYNDTVYLYTGHDEDDATGFKMMNWLLYTSTDMVNWTDCGIAATLSAFTWADPNNGAWASQCIYRNGKFYWYCAVQLRGIGVLVSSSPYGPFTDPIGKALINNSSDDIDPTVWIDDDGQAYMYWGNPNCYYIKLNQDMISYSGGITEISSKPSDYQEGPWFHKRNGIYYLSYSSTCCPEGIGYAMSTGPTGPWTWKGKIMDPNSASSGNQPGIIDYKGNSYCFGFNYYLNYLETTEHRERRSVCVDIMNYNTDGTIVKMPWWTTTGAPQIGALNPYVQTEAETICFSSGIKSEVCGDGGIDVCNIENGDYIKVKGVDFGTGATSFDARVSSATSGGNIEIRLDSTSGTLVGTCQVPGTGGWQTWVTKTCTVSNASSKHDLYFRFTGGSGFLFNFNWWKFYGGEGTSPPTPEPTAVSTPGPTGTPNQEPIFSGGPYTLNGTSDYVDLPDGLTNDLYDFSIACWVKLNTLDTWTRVYDFGGDTNVFMMLTPASGNTGYSYFCITTSGNAGEQGLDGSSAMPVGSWQHITVTRSGSTGILYINGQEVDRNTGMTLNPADLGNTTNNFIGRSQWSNDPYLNGEVDDFVIYNRAISASEVSALSSTPPDGTPEPTAVSTPVPTDTPKPAGSLGDVNGSGAIDIVDALLIAQYYVGLNPSGFIAANADTNCDGSIDIVDALIVAQYYVGLIQSFC